MPLRRLLMALTVCTAVVVTLLQTKVGEDGKNPIIMCDHLPPPSTHYQLAKEESFGFFDDISDNQWKRAQDIHASVFPNHYTKDATRYTTPFDSRASFRPDKQGQHWYGENFHVEFHCPHARRIPSTGHADGPKWVCDPHRIASSPSCLVYSVGSNFNAQFEKGVINEVSPDCEIHTFDIKKGGRLAAALQNVNTTFHPWGIGSRQQSEESEKDPNSKYDFKTLPETIQALGHENRTIDVFKIDCEHCEWETYQTWFESGADLRQILIETHDAPFPQARDFFYTLHDLGYVIFSKESANGMCYEYGFVKLKTSFFVNDTMYRSITDNGLYNAKGIPLEPPK